MKKLITLLSVMVLAMTLGASPGFAKEKKSKGASPKGITFILTGNYSLFGPFGGGCGAGVCTGHIVGITTPACDVVEGMAVTLSVFDYMDGICDDGPTAGQSATAATLPACDGRYTARVEECSRGAPSLGGVDGLTYQIDEKKPIGGTSPLDVTISRGAMEICFDSSASGATPANCWPLSGSELVIFEGTTLSQTISVSARSSVSSRSEFTAVATPQWTDPVDGKVRDAKKLDNTTSHLTAEAFSGSNCGSGLASSLHSTFGTGCGVAGVSTKK